MTQLSLYGDAPDVNFFWIPNIPYKISGNETQKKLYMLSHLINFNTIVLFGK